MPREKHACLQGEHANCKKIPAKIPTQAFCFLLLVFWNYWPLLKSRGTGNSVERQEEDMPQMAQDWESKPRTTKLRIKAFERGAHSTNRAI